MEIVVVIFIVSWALAVIDFLFYLVNKERCLGNAVLRIVNFFTLSVGPLLFLFGLLLVLGQQPGSVLKAFTEVYDGYGLFQALLIPMWE